MIPFLVRYFLSSCLYFFFRPVLHKVNSYLDLCILYFSNGPDRKWMTSD